MMIAHSLADCIKDGCELSMSGGIDFVKLTYHNSA